MAGAVTKTIALTKRRKVTSEKIAILDAGAQYGKVIDRRVRELAVECDLLPLDTKASDLMEYAGVIVSGGPQSVYDADAPAYDPQIFSLGVPLLGICYGMQLLNYANGGTVERKSKREDGQFEVAAASHLIPGPWGGLVRGVRVCTRVVRRGGGETEGSGGGLANHTVASLDRLDWRLTVPSSLASVSTPWMDETWTRTIGGGDGW
jgi:hypothetical protein